MNRHEIEARLHDWCCDCMAFVPRARTSLYVAACVASCELQRRVTTDEMREAARKVGFLVRTDRATGVEYVAASLVYQDASSRFAVEAVL